MLAHLLPTQSVQSFYLKGVSCEKILVLTTVTNKLCVPFNRLLFRCQYLIKDIYLHRTHAQCLLSTQPHTVNIEVILSQSKQE